MGTTEEKRIEKKKVRCQKGEGKNLLREEKNGKNVRKVTENHFWHGGERSYSKPSWGFLNRKKGAVTVNNSQVTYRRRKETNTGWGLELGKKKSILLQNKRQSCM